MANKKVSQLVSKPSVLVTDLFPIADPTTGQLFKTTISDLGTAIGSGVSSVNTLVGAVVLDTDDIQELASPTNRWFTDTRARAALSASSPLAYNSGTGAFSIPAATTSVNGYLTSTDWTTFNAKQAALSGTGFVKISGTTISYDNSTYLTTSAAASTYLALAGGTLTGALNGTSATFTGDLTLSASNPRLYFTDTDNNPDYFISNTDGTFTIYDVTNSTSRLTLTNLYTTLNNTLRIQGDILLNQDSTIGPVAGYTTIASDASGIFLRLGTASSHAYLVLSGLTSFRNFTLPDATGTFALTSDLSAYLPLAGGTMSGAITTTNVYLTGMTSGSGALYYSSGSNRVTVANYNASGIVVFEVNGGSTALTLNSNLSATFASTLNATGATLTGALSGTSATFSDSANTILTLNSTNANGYTATQINYSGAAKALIGFGTYLTTDGGVAIRTAASTPFTIAIGGGTPTMTLATTGAATFSSSVTAGDLISTSYGTARIQVTSTTNSANSAFRLGAKDSAGTSKNAGLYYVAGTTTATTFLSLVADDNNYQFNVLANGNVGIGTTAPGKRLDVFTTATSATEYQLSLRNGAGANNVSTGIAFGFNSSSLDPDYLSAISSIVTDRSTRAADLTFLTSATGTLAERMRITSSGDLLVGKTSSNWVTVGLQTEINGKTLGVTNATAGDNNLFLRKNGIAGNVAAFYYDSTQVGYIAITSTTTTYNTTSDYRLKEDLKPINGLEIVNKIKVYDYKWKANDSRMDGVLAHELAEVLPYAVNGVKDGEQMQGVDYSKIVPVMVQAIKDLKAKIETLENK